MSITHSLDRDHRYMRTVARGVVTYDDSVRHLEEEALDGALGFREIVDARDVTLDLSSADVRSLVSLLRQYGRSEPLGATAVVVTTDVAYGTARMCATLLDDLSPTEVFRDMRAAEQWLLQQPETEKGAEG